MRRIAEDILIFDEIKTDFILDENGKPTDVLYEYKEYHVVDADGNVLEINRYTEDTITVEEICNRTGIKFGLSAWIS
jgi:hypothetical protein